MLPPPLCGPGQRPLRRRLRLQMQPPFPPQSPALTLCVVHIVQPAVGAVGLALNHLGNVCRRRAGGGESAAGQGQCSASQAQCARLMRLTVGVVKGGFACDPAPDLVDLRAQLFHSTLAAASWIQALPSGSAPRALPRTALEVPAFLLLSWRAMASRTEPSRHERNLPGRAGHGTTSPEDAHTSPRTQSKGILQDCAGLVHQGPLGALKEWQAF